MSDPKHPTAAAERLAFLRAEGKRLREELKAVESELDTHRVKCPTCRCRILPGDACSCCADVGWDYAFCGVEP